MSHCRQQEFIHSVFPLEFPGIEPEFLFFDNACGLRSYITGRQDFDLLCRMAIVVDAFHFSGHKESHADCQANCNPKVFPVLKGKDGKWVFNSSAAEQVNAWFGKFQSKVKEMNYIRLFHVDFEVGQQLIIICRYNFFLDEVIDIHNSIREEELNRSGAEPFRMDREELSTHRRKPRREGA